MLFEKYYGGFNDDRGYKIQSTSDGGSVVAGMAASSNGHVVGNHSPGLADFWVVKLNSSGDLQWSKCYGGSARDTAFSIVQTPDNGFVIAGSSTSNNGDLTGNNGGTDGWIVRVDSLGNILWQKNYGGAGAETIKDLVLNSDNTLTAVGRVSSSNAVSNSYHAKEDLWILKISLANGDLIWSKAFGGLRRRSCFLNKKNHREWILRYRLHFF